MKSYEFQKALPSNTGVLLTVKHPICSALVNEMADLEISCEWPTFPSDETLHEAFEIEIKTQNGDSVRFGELVAGKGDSITTIVIFGELKKSPRPSE